MKTYICQPGAARANTEIFSSAPLGHRLTPELKAGIDSRVKSGQYGNASAVIRAGLRALARGCEAKGPRMIRAVFDCGPLERV